MITISIPPTPTYQRGKFHRQVMLKCQKHTQVRLFVQALTEMFLTSLNRFFALAFLWVFLCVQMFFWVWTTTTTSTIKTILSLSPPTKSIHIYLCMFICLFVKEKRGRERGVQLTKRKLINNNYYCNHRITIAPQIFLPIHEETTNAHGNMQDDVHVCIHMSLASLTLSVIDANVRRCQGYIHSNKTGYANRKRWRAREDIEEGIEKRKSR